MDYDLLHIQGKPYVLMPLHDYRDMASSGARDALPEAILDQLAAAQENPIKIIRKYRDLTQVELASAAGLSRPYLAEIETGKKQGSLTALKQLASALEVGVETLINE